MESSDPASQLSDINRLRRETVTESLRARPWALPVLAVATVLYFSTYEIQTRLVPVVAPAAWIIFIILWVRWLRSTNRVRPDRQRAVSRWRHDLPLWLGLLVVANLIALLGERVSWVVAGVLMASLGTVTSLVLRRVQQP